MVADHIREVIFVGLPGPTHNYGGLSGDNVASSTNRGQVSSPREAALQTLSLARLLASLGVHVALVPPQLRPHTGLLATKFSGSIEAMLRQAAKEDPALLEKACSSSAMWTANAATVSASADTTDKKLHLTVANLHRNPHRRIEAQETHAFFSAAFARVPDAVVHPPFDAGAGLFDEGAANHMRLAPRHEKNGLNVFVYGTDGSTDDPATARQNLAASEALVAEHHLAGSSVLTLRQNPRAIARGVFHNDVIAVANEQVLLVHEEAYAGGYGDIARIEEAYHALHPKKTPVVLVVKSAQMSLEEAVQTYFFNSQIVTTIDDRGAEGPMAVIAPMEMKLLNDGRTAALMDSIASDPGNPIESVHYLDLRQSMRNGGGPACLRLRVPMSLRQIGAMEQSVNVLAGRELLAGVEQVVEAHYPEQLSSSELADPALYQRAAAAQKAFFELMKLPLF